MFGGYDGSDKNDVWTLNLTSYNWTERTTSTTKPSARRLIIVHSLRWTDGVFGGIDGNITNDVWTLNLTSYNWTEVTTSTTKPSARERHSSVLYNGQMVCLGDLMVVRKTTYGP